MASIDHACFFIHQVCLIDHVIGAAQYLRTWNPGPCVHFVGWRQGGIWHGPIVRFVECARFVLFNGNFSGQELYINCFAGKKNFFPCVMIEKWRVISLNKELMSKAEFFASQHYFQCRFDFFKRLGFTVDIRVVSFSKYWWWLHLLLKFPSAWL